MSHEGGHPPIVETTKEMAEYLNKGNLEGYQKTGFFVYHDVIVCEAGRKQEVALKLGAQLHSLPNAVGGSVMSPVGHENLKK